MGVTNTAPVAGSPIWVTALVTDDVGVAGVTLNYRVGGGVAGTNTVFLETMRAVPVKPWTGDGCDNPWTVTYSGGNPFEQRGGANFGIGNTNGLEFKNGTVNLTDSMVAPTSTIDCRGDSGFVEFYVKADGQGGTSGWAFQVNGGTGFVTRVSELTGTNHNWLLYHYDLQPSELVSNMAIRFQFEGAVTTNRVDLDTISVEVASAGAGWTNVAMFDDGLHGDGATDDGIYGALIPAQDGGTSVSYYLTGIDGNGMVATYPAGGAASPVSLVVAGAPAAQAFDVLLGRPTDTAIAVSVLATTNMDAYCEYGTQPGNYTAQTAVTNHLVGGTPGILDIGSLRADTQYYYRLRYQWPGDTTYSAGAEGAFHTQRASTNSFTFIIEADPHYLDNDPPVWKLALTNMLADKPDFLIDLGDTFMGEKYGNTNGGYSISQTGIYEACRVVRNEFFSISGPSIPLFLVNGNHDPELGWLLSNSQPTNNSAVWGSQARDFYYPSPAPGAFYSGSTNADPYLSGGARDGYYAFEWGNALFVMLDNFWYSWQGVSKSKDPWDWTLGRQQYDWLKRTLETSRARIKLVFAHHLVGGLPGSNTDARGGLECARYAEWGGYNTNGTWGFTDKRPGWPMPIQDLLLTNGVSAFFHGHDHLFVKQDLDANGDGRPELIYQECPQPSRQYGNFGPTNSAVGYGYTNGVIQGSSGYLRVQVTPTNAIVDYVRVFLPENEGVGRTNRMVTYSYTLEPPVPVAGFIASPTTGGAPLETTFADTSFGAITNRLWSFGDGAIASTGATNLAHTYGIPGTNIVRLIVSGPLGASTNAGTIIATSVDTIGDGIPNWWRALYFGGNGSTTNALSSASGDPTGGGLNNLDKYTADLDPTNRASLLQFLSISVVTSDVRLVWIGGTKAWQYLECSPELTSNSWRAIFTNTPPTPVTNTVIDPGAVDEGSLFYRIRALR